VTLNNEFEVGKLLPRDYVDATIGFKAMPAQPSLPCGQHPEGRFCRRCPVRRTGRDHLRPGRPQNRSGPPNIIIRVIDREFPYARIRQSPALAGSFEVPCNDNGISGPVGTGCHGIIVLIKNRVHRLHFSVNFGFECYQTFHLMLVAPQLVNATEENYVRSWLSRHGLVSHIRCKESRGQKTKGAAHADPYQARQ